MYFNVENLKNMIHLELDKKEYFFLFGSHICKNLDDSRNYERTSHPSASTTLYAFGKYQRSYGNQQ
jgi:hypothetical protein